MPQRALLVDDDANLRTITQISLEDVGNFEVHAVDSGEGALAAAREQKFDVILLDVMMPLMDGVETFRRLRAQGCTAPVIFLTAKIAQLEMDEYMQLGATGILSKPFDPMTLANDVRTLLAKAARADSRA